MHIWAAELEAYVKLRDSEGKGLEGLEIRLATTLDNELLPLIF